MRALIALVVLAFLSWPLWRLTHATAAPQIQTAAPGPASALQKLTLRLDFTTAARNLKISHLGQEVFSAATPPRQTAIDLMLPYPKDGVDLVFGFEWPEGPPCALRARLTDPSGAAHEKTLWANGTVEESLTFP